MNRQWLVPKLTRGFWRNFSTSNLINSYVHTYWFPDQQQEDSDDPTYQPPDCQRFPLNWNLLQHPRIVRMNSEASPAKVDSTDPGAFTFSFSLFPVLEGVTLTVQNVAEQINIYGMPDYSIVVTGSTSIEKGTKIKVGKKDPIVISTEQGQPDIIFQARLAAGPGPFETGYGLINGTYTSTPLTSSSDGTATNAWAAAMSSLELELKAFAYSQLMTNLGWIANVVPCDEEDDHTFYGPNIVNIRVFTNLDSIGYYDPATVVDHPHAKRIIRTYDTFYHYHTFVILDTQAGDDGTFFDELSEICSNLSGYGFEFLGEVDSTQVDIGAYLSGIVNDYFRSL